MHLMCSELWLLSSCGDVYNHTWYGGQLYSPTQNMNKLFILQSRQHSVTPLYHLQGDGIDRKPATAELSRVTWSSLPHEWAPAAASGGSAHVLAIDIAGAFDKVSHAGLLHKAFVYGLDGTLHGRIKLFDWPEYPCSSLWAIFLVI